MYRSHRETAFEILEELRSTGLCPDAILEYIVGNNLPGYQAMQLMCAVRQEFLRDVENEEDEE